MSCRPVTYANRATVAMIDQAQVGLDDPGLFLGHWIHLRTIGQVQLLPNDQAHLLEIRLLGINSEIWVLEEVKG